MSEAKFSPLLSLARHAQRRRMEMQCDPQWVLDLAGERDDLLAVQQGAVTMRDLLKRYLDALDRFDLEGPASLAVAAAKEAGVLEKELRAMLAGAAE